MESVWDFPIFVLKSRCSLKKRSALGIGLACLKIFGLYGSHRLCPITSTCLVIEGCRCPRSTILELCKIFQRATENYIASHIWPAGCSLDHFELAYILSLFSLFCDTYKNREIQNYILCVYSNSI